MCCQNRSSALTEATFLESPDRKANEAGTANDHFHSISECKLRWAGI